MDDRTKLVGQFGVLKALLCCFIIYHQLKALYSMVGVAPLVRSSVVGHLQLDNDRRWSQ